MSTMINYKNDNNGTLIITTVQNIIVNNSVQLIEGNYDSASHSEHFIREINQVFTYAGRNNESRI